jgi:hypothetical protein
MESVMSIQSRSSMRISPLTYAFVCTMALFLGPSLRAETFKVLVLDALDGVPQAGMSVDYFCEGQRWLPSDHVTTNSKGIAEISYACSDQARIEISLRVPGNQNKEECGGLGAQTIRDIMSIGVISQPNAAGNIWCPTKISRKLKPVPGQVTIFIKKPTWWQSHVAG